jgi:hypothetical protein
VNWLLEVWIACLEVEETSATKGSITVHVAAGKERRIPDIR